MIVTPSYWSKMEVKCIVSTLLKCCQTTFSAIIWRKTANTLSPTQIMHCIIPAEMKKVWEHGPLCIGTHFHIWDRRQVPTRLVFLNSFVFKVSKHDLEPVRIIGSQHPETEEAEEILRVVSALKTQIHHFNAVMTILSLPGELTSRKQNVKWSRPDVF